MSQARKMLYALRNAITRRSGRTLARQLTYKDMLELVDEALHELEEEEASGG